MSGTENLATAIERCVAQHNPCLTEPAAPVKPQDQATEPVTPTGRMAQRRREHHAMVHDLLGRGYSHRQIARHLGWGRRTVARYAHAAAWQDMLHGHRQTRRSILDPFKAHLVAPVDARARHGPDPLPRDRRSRVYRQLRHRACLPSHPARVDPTAAAAAGFIDPATIRPTSGQGAPN